MESCSKKGEWLGMKIMTKDLALHSRCGLNRLPKRLPMFFALFYLLCATLQAQTQEVPSPDSTALIETTTQTSSALPDAPQPVAQSAMQAPLPDFAMRTQQKFRYASENAFGISSAIFAAAGAGVNQAQNLYPEFHQGAEGYGRYFWHSYADQAVDSYFVNFILAEALHTDPRYHPLRSGSAWARLKHTGASVVLTHTDSGKLTFNAPQVLGSGMAASVSSLYYPERDRTASLVTQRWASNLAGDTLLMGIKEFTPELVGIGKHVCLMISFGVLFCKDSQSAGH
jgi:hypothetical protein